MTLVGDAVSGGSGEEPGGRLSQFQLDLAAVFFALPQSVGFLLAGGGALIAQELVSRETDDLDFFADRRAGDVPAAGEALIAAVGERGWDAEVIRSSPEFRRIKVTRTVAGEAETMYVDLALDSPPTGDGANPMNVFTQCRGVNRGGMRVFEAEVAKKVAGGERVYYVVALEYRGRVIPDRVNVGYVGSRGSADKDGFSNTC